MDNTRENSLLKILNWHFSQEDVYLMVIKGSEKSYTKDTVVFSDFFLKKDLSLFSKPLY